MHVNTGLISILSGDGYVIESATVDGFNGKVDYERGGFNFDSLTEYFASSDEQTDAPSSNEPVKWFVKRIAITNSTFAYHDFEIGEEIIAENINISLPEGISWNALGAIGNLDLQLKSGGDLVANFEFENDYSAFKTDLNLTRVENVFLLPYIQDFLLVSTIQGTIGMDVHLAGSLIKPGDLDLSGIMRLDSAAMFNLQGEKLFGIGGLMLSIDSINPSTDIYAVQAINISNPYGWFQLFDDGNNLSRLLKDSVIAEQDSIVVQVDSLLVANADSTTLKTDTFFVAEAETIEVAEVSTTDHSSNFFLLIGDYVKQAMKDIQVSDFRLDTLSIKGLSFDFEDHTLLMPFKYSTSQADLYSYGVTSSSDSVMVYSSAILGDSGFLKMEARLDPTLHEKFRVNLKLNDVGLVDISPYSHQFLAHKIEKGRLLFDADVDIDSGKLNSLLHLRIDSLEISDKERHDEALKLPIKLTVKVLKGKSGIIDLEVPVVGNLNDPEYKLGKAIGKIFKNLITKSANTRLDTSASKTTVELPIDSEVLPVDTVAPIR